MAEKKYYWLKMTDQFFEDKAIKKLRKIAGGDTYTIIYLKMLLTAIKQGTLHIKRVLKAKKEAYRVKEISFKQATDTLQSYLGMMKYCDCDALKEKILDDFVLTHADMKQIYEEGGDRDENYYRRGDGWSVEDYPVTDETYRPAGTCITAAWNY